MTYLRDKDIRKDLKDLGFSVFGKGVNTYSIKPKNVYVVHLLGDTMVVTKDIKLPDGNDANTNVFQGVIKSKNELKTLLSQVGCLP